MNTDIITQVVAETNRLEAQLVHTQPQVIEEARRIADEVLDPNTASRTEIWTRLWDKPLYANAKVSAAGKWVEQLRPFMEDALLEWGADGGAICIERIGAGVAKSSFKLSGHASETLLADTSVARHRLFRIQGAATGLRTFPEEAPFKRYASLPLEEAVNELREAFGEGWGAITVLHALTDVGLAVKPDLHLVRTCRAVGLLDGKTVADVPNLKQSLEVNDLVRSLCKAKFGVVTARNIRYLDLLLMQISMQGLLATHIRAPRDLEYLDICRPEPSPGDFTLSISFPQGAAKLRSGHISLHDLAGLMAISSQNGDARLCGDDWPIEIKTMTIDFEKRDIKLVAEACPRVIK